MTLEPLKRFDIQYVRAKDPGRPPELAWLSISMLGTNPEYQRPVSKKGENTIQRIMAAFSWSRFSPVIVRRVPGTKEAYEIIDGQHRSTAALNCGYDRVPCMIVKCSDAEAARIFAAVNGTVTPMHVISVYKAALAGGEPWALECRAAAEAAGVRIHTRPTPYSQQRPYETCAVGTIRNVWRQQGPKVLEATFRLILASRGSEEIGFVASRLISHWGAVLASRPGWVSNIESICLTLHRAQVNLANETVESVETKLAQRMGGGRTGEAAEDIKAKVADALGRRLSAQMIAASLRLPYAEVNRLIEEIRAETPKLEAPR